MFYQTETKFQGWRALAVLEDGSQCLVYVGRSTTQIRAGYAAAFMKLLDESERARVRSISMQCWQGAADMGRWVSKANLSIPSRPTAARGPEEQAGHGPPGSSPGTEDEAVPANPQDRVILPFPGPTGEPRSAGSAQPLVLPFRRPVAPDHDASPAPGREEPLVV